VFTGKKTKKSFFSERKQKKKLSKCFEARWNLRICIYSKIDFEETHLDVSLTQASFDKESPF